jgi:hypothetical protein
MNAALFQPPDVPEWSTLSPTSMSSNDEPSELAQRRDLDRLWRAGRLSWKLDEHQLRVYEHYRAWESQPQVESKPGDMPRIFVMDVSRRWGKTFLCDLIKIEDCIRQPGSLHTYACAFAKDIAEIILPLTDDICEDAPEDVRPQFRSSHQGRSMGLFFPNGSQLRLVGIDMNPRGLRGRGSDGFCVSEAGHVKKLKRTVSDVVYPQFQRRAHARMILESNAPEDIDHDFDKYFVPDAQRRQAYVFQTIDDNQALPESEKQEFIDAAGGRGAPTCEREYYGVRVRDPQRTVIPEFQQSVHVVSITMPKYAQAYGSADPGTRDKYGLVFAYWDWARQVLVVRRSWAKTNAGLRDVADVVRTANRELWGVGQAVGPGSAGYKDADRSPEPLQWWDGEKLRDNPYRQISDTDARAIGELNREHDVKFTAADKRLAKKEAQSGSARRLPEAKLASLRQAFRDNRIEISVEDVPDGDYGALAIQLQNGRWNETRTDFERTDELGHLDCVMALAYLWHAIDKNTNPNKPDWADMDPRECYVPPTLKKQKQTVVVLNKVFGGGSRFRQPVTRFTSGGI